MNRIGRITTYPTDQFNKVGFHSYELGFMSGFKTFYVSPNIKGTPFNPRGNDEIKTISFFLKVYPLKAIIFHKLIFLLRRIFSIIVFSFRAIYYLSGKKITIIHVHSPMYSLIVLWAKITNKKAYITFHGEDFNKIKRSLLYQITSSLYNGVFAISPTMINRLKEIHGCNVLLVGNGIESDYVNFHEQRSKQIVFVGSFKSVKGHAMMIDGFELFLKNNSGYILLFAGIGPLLEEIKDYVDTKGLNSNIVFLGHKTKEDLIKIYNKSLVFVLNSFSEGFPKVILEAVACGCRVVSTRVGSVPDILGKDYPYFIENHNAHYISKVLEKVIKADNKSFIKYENIADNYSWSPVKKIYQNEYLKERV